MLNFQNLQLRRGTRVLFEDATFTVFRGEKVGIIGANGSGKSSLLALVRGELHAEAGDFTPPGRAADRLGRAGNAGGRAKRARLRDGRRYRAARGGARHRRRHGRVTTARSSRSCTRATKRSVATPRAAAPAQLLAGVGFASADLERTVAAFSGGWRMRLNLAQALMCRSDLLLLDEPTNHLDLDAVIWLETWLRDYRGTLLLIAHDREFLDRVRVAHRAHRAARRSRSTPATIPRSRASAPPTSR